MCRGDSPYLFMSILAGKPSINHSHNHVLGGHEGELEVDSLFDDCFVDYETGGDVVELYLCVSYHSQAMLRRHVPISSKHQRRESSPAM